ncbi:uncharacterized protein LOC105425539 [Pogonomyrmex barbatus]|uniref:Uncharacterized protein LOC105425539 n=1 Tax=Pogonomyrmex barbatus TaxID=144034 RepID=A0A6I9W7N3_9HYME|nr:uncharacterized protein LOC105425539 [Pogonomyrmex barbatus]
MFYRFPKDPEKHLLWLKAINRITVGKNARLCSKHFEAKYYRYGIVEQRRFLLPAAVPTLYLCPESENNDIEVNNSELTESELQINMSFCTDNTTSEHEKTYNKLVLTHNETKTTFDKQDKLSNEEQMLLQNNMQQIKNTEESNEESEFNQDENLIFEEIADAQGNRKRYYYPSHTDVKSKHRIRYIGDVNWNVICHNPSEARYYGVMAVKEIKALRKELNVRKRKIRYMRKKISNLQSLLMD